jgi:membrane-associated protease RseP (regulator of RpoE activity)
MMALGVLGFAIAVLVSVMLHEAGHFVAAKAFGMKATQFFVGFGPTLWSRQKGETEYGVKAIPAGGFVKIIGMTPLEDVPPQDQPRTFLAKPGPQRFVVLVAGSTMHFVIGLVLLFVFLAAWPSRASGYATIDQVYPCALPNSDGTCPAGAPAAPADGVLQKGDVVLAVDGQDLKTTPAVLHGDGAPASGQQVKGGYEGLVALVRASTGPVTLTIERHGHRMNVTLTPVAENGVPHLGVAPADQYTYYGVLAAAARTPSTFGSLFVGSFAALGHVPHEVGHLLTHPQAKRSLVGSSGSSSQVTSVVGVAHVAGQAFQADGVSGGVAFLVGVVASVNVFIGIFNLFPLLPLDGGHVAILFYEKARDAIRRRRRQPAAGPVDLTKLMPVTYAALALIVGISLVLLYADAVNPVSNPFQ